MYACIVTTSYVGSCSYMKCAEHQVNVSILQALIWLWNTVLKSMSIKGPSMHAGVRDCSMYYMCAFH